MTHPEHRIFVAGTVRPQGSMTLARDPRTGREFARYSPTTIQWRNTLYGALTAWWEHKSPITTPVEVHLTATFARPKHHLGTGKNTGVVKPSAPQWHATYPDADKSARAVGDALAQAGVIADDALIAVWRIQKLWCHPTQKPGATITVKELQP